MKHIQIRGLNEFLGRIGSMDEGLRVQLLAALHISLRDIQVEAQENHNFTSRSGKVEREIKTKVYSNGRSNSFYGEVGTDYDIGIFQHEGTGIYGPSNTPIWVEPREKRALRWSIGGDNFAFSKGHIIWGIKPDPFIYNAADKKEPVIQSRFEAVISKAVSGVNR